MQRLLLSLVLLGLGAGVVYLYLNEGEVGSSPERPARPPVPVTAYEVQPKEFQNQVNALGTLRAWESVDITSSVAETVVALHFEDGQRVDRGQLLVTLKQDEEQASLREQQEVLAEQEREVARLEDLARKNQVAQTEVDQRRTLALGGKLAVKLVHGGAGSHRHRHLLRRIADDTGRG